jgi:hypothetical protein
MTRDSVNSADGMEAFHPTSLREGLTFQAQPNSAKHPIHRPRVSSPYQKKIPPGLFRQRQKVIMRVKRTFDEMSEAAEDVAGTLVTVSFLMGDNFPCAGRSTYEDARICYSTRRKGNEAEDKDSPVNNFIQYF